MSKLHRGHDEGSCFGERAIEKRLGTLGKYAPLSGGRLLDLGCGRGNYTMALAAGFDSVDAVDLDSEHIEVFRQRLLGTGLAGKIHPAVMPSEGLDFPAGHFDVVTVIEVLEHVDDVDLTLGEIARVLKPGGHFLLTGPNRFFPLETHGFKIRGKRHRPLHFPFLPWIPPLHSRLSGARAFTSRSVSRQIERHGFRTVAVDHIMPPFDRSKMGKRLRPFTDGLERTPLRVFGITLIGVYQRQGQEAGRVVAEAL